MSAHIQKLIAPRSIAIVGASNDPHKLGNIVLRNILSGGFSGKLYPVNLKEKKVAGLQAYNQYIHIPEIPDLAVIAIPAAFVVDVVREIGQKGTRAVVIFSAGFKEEGSDGAVLEAELLAVAEEYDISILGPNCLGFVSTSKKINATFGQGGNRPGRMHFISQSGAIATSIFDWAERHELGFLDFVTLGNKTNINENHFLQYWLDHPEKSSVATRKFNESTYHPIGMYLESLSDGAQFIEIARKIAQKNPLFLLKPGKSAAAQKAMQSHTGAIAGDDLVLSQALDQAGVIRCEEIEDMFNLSLAFSWSKAPGGKSVAILSNAGGPAVVSSDAVAQAGLSMAQLSKNTKELLEQHLHRAANVLNPVDVLGDALSDRYEKALKVLLEEETVDAVVIILTPQIMTEIEETATVIGRLSQKYEVPIFCSFMGGHLVSRGEEVLRKYRIPFFTYPEKAIRVLGKMWWWKSWQKKNKKNQRPVETVPVAQSVKNHYLEFIRKQLVAGNQYLESNKINELFDDWDIATPASAVVSSLEQTKRFAKKHSFPVVLKLSAPKLLHKTEVSGVITGIGGMKQLEAASQELISRKTELPAQLRKSVKIQVQAQIEEGVEVIVGIKRTPEFGAVLMFGAGGTLVELISDHNLQVLPVTQEGIQEMVEKSKAYSLLKGYRGGQELALGKLYHLIAQLTDLVQTLPFFAEIEINPVIVTKTEAYAVDGKVVLSEF